MKLSPFLAGLLALGAAGCGFRGYYRAGATEQDFLVQYNACERDFAPMMGPCFGYGCLLQSGDAKGSINRCMRAHGWTIRRGPDVFQP
jgi:hypothetical protein